MDPLSSAGAGIQRLDTGAGQVRSENKEESAKPPVDSLEKGTQDEEGLVHKMFRGIGKAVGGVMGSVSGAAKGGIQGAASEKPHELVGPEGTKLIRATGAAGGLITCAVAGLITGGIPGLVIGSVAGPIVGSALAGALPGALDGAYAASKGALKGTWDGMKNRRGTGRKVRGLGGFQDPQCP